MPYPDTATAMKKSKAHFSGCKLCCETPPQHTDHCLPRGLDSTQGMGIKRHRLAFCLIYDGLALSALFAYMIAVSDVTKIDCLHCVERFYRGFMLDLRLNRVSL